MQLDEFVAETLKQIISGIKIAQAYATENGAKVSPSNIFFANKEGTQMLDKTTGGVVDKIEFDVAVTTTEGAQTKGGVGIFVGAVGLGSQGQSNLTNQSYSHIRFSVPISYPKG